MQSEKFDTGYDARAIANLILDNVNSREYELSNLKLNKILFFVHGIYLSRNEAPLIKNHVEAWKYGPVYKTVYHSFKKFGNNPIEGRATTYDYFEERQKIVPAPVLSEKEYDLIVRVANYFSRFSAEELVDLTHAEGTPWRVVRDSQDFRLFSRIPQHLIENFFVEKYGGSRTN